MSRPENTSQDSYDKSGSMYPTKEQFACVRCKNKKFTSWNDFENHHAKHAVDFTFSQLPIVKLQRIKIFPFSSENVRTENQNSEIQPSNAISNSIDKTTIPSVVPEASDRTPIPHENEEPSESKLPEEEEMLTWPGSCESSSPVNSPIPVSTLSETITSSNTAATGEPQVDSNILDPAFIEKLGEEISFLNQTLADSVTDTIANVPKESLAEIQSCDVNISGSSSSSISISDFPVSSLGDIQLAEQITSETPPAEKATTYEESDKPRNEAPVINEKDMSDSENESIPPPKEEELPKSKGQLRLVPYESLLSPSFLHANQVEEDDSTALQSPISPSKTSNKPQAMVAIPERNLEDLNILARTLTADSAPIKPLTEAVSTQQVLQKSQPTPPPEISVQNVIQATLVASMPPQQQRMAQVYQFQNLTGQGNHHPQAHQQQIQQKQIQQQQTQQRQTQQQQTQQQQTQQQQTQQQQTQQRQIQQPTQQQQIQQPTQQQQIQQPTQQQQIQQPTQQQIQQQQQTQQQLMQQQQHQQNHPQQQMHFQQQQYLQQQHQGLSTLQYQQQQQPYQQQIVAGQQQHLYAQASQYIQRFSNQPRMQYPIQSYSASCRAIPPNQLTRAAMNSAMTLTNSNGTIHVPPVSSNHFQQTTNNSVPSMPSSSLIQQQLAGPSSYNHAVHINSSFPHYSNRPQTSTIQHVQLQIPAAQSNRPSVPSTQPSVRPQAIALQSQGIRIVQSSTSTNSPRLQQPIQQRQGFVAIRPHPQPPNSVCSPRGSLPASSQVTPNSQIVVLPTTSTPSVITSSTVRLPPSSHQGQVAANAVNRPANHKRPLVVEGGISGAGQPAQKIARTEDATAVSSNVSTAQQSGDCELLIVQKKQTGLPVIQSVEGGGNLLTAKSSVQTLQTPSVASLLSNPNITVTPAKNKENQAGSDSVASKAINTSTTSGVNSVVRTRPITIDLTTTTSSQPQQRNPLQCQVCNETFNSQSLLKNHLVLHLRKVHPTTARPTNSPPVNRNSVSKQAAANSSTSRASNVNGPTTDMVTPSTSGYVTAIHGSTTNKQATPAVVRPTDSDICSVNASQKTKNGATSGQSRLTNEVNATPLNTTSPAQSCSSKEPTCSSIPTDKADSSNSEFYIPVVDLKRQDVITQLESMGINQFIPASNLTSCSNHNNFAIPIMSASALRRAGTTGFPSLCGVVNLGSPKLFSTNPQK